MASYIRGRLNVACCNLIDELRSQGIKASVGHSCRGWTLIVRVKDPRQLDQVPKEWNGYTLQAEVAKS